MTRVEQTRLARGDWDSLQRFSALTHFDLVVGMRLHSLIAALREGVPCVGVQYDPKVGAFLEGMGLGKYAIDLQDFDPQGLVDRVLDAYEKREYFKQIAKGFWRNTTATTESAMMAKDLLEKPRSTPTFPPFLVDFTVQQTLNVSHSEEEKIRLNDLFRRIWEDRLDPNFHYEMAWTDLNWIETQLRSDHERMAVLVRENREALERSQIFQEESERLAKENREIEQRLAMENSQRMDAEETLRQVQSDSWQLREELSRIENSRGFKVLRFLWGILWRIRDPKQQILEFKVFLAKVGSWVAGRTRGFRSWIYRTFKGILPAWLRYLNFVLNIHHLILEDRSTVVLYTDEEQLFAGYQLRKRIKDMRTQPVRVTLVTTMKDEADNAQSWLEDLEHQTRPPDEVILVDGGSSDRTLEILESFAAKSSLDVKVLSKPGSNIAAGRNLGIELASHPLIAVTDFGCTLKVDWLEKLLVPFGGDPEMEVVAGWYEAFADSRIGESAKHELIPTLKHITPDTFLPATRSIAFRKTAWEEVGGFPEWLTITGEDTYFDLQLKRNCNRWAFVPDARVIWHSPKTVREIWKKLSNWTAGDGESGAFVHQYWTFMGDYFWSSFFTLLGLAIAVASFWIHPLLGAGFIFIWCLIIFLSLSVSSDHRKGAVQGFWKRFGRAARVNGFLRGIRNRQRVALRRYDGVRGVVFLLSGVPIDDTGGGARGTQITLELLQRGYLVIFVHKYPKQESVDLRIDFDQPNLLHFALKDFDWKAICWEHRLLLKSKPVTTILEFPFKEYLPFVKSTRRMGGTVIYDLIDDWNTSLGGDWYSVKTEQAIINASDVLAASAPSLVERLQHASGRRDVLWVPNAVNLRLFDRESSQPCPEDLPCGSPRILYIGALWGEWFDWDLLQKIARAYPQAAVTIIGDYRGHCPFNEPNLHFLGLKPQTSLPAYLRHSDVAIIPWEISPITQSTSPLKVFEYLAMGVPVVAPKLNPLEGIPYVFLARDHDEFIENIERACSCVIENEILDEFVEKNSWRARMDTLAEQVPHLREGEL
jgi:glycosyltransferase involved in cell wall biosynthesis